MLKKIALLLVVVGGLNWGLVGAFKFNLVETLFGMDSVITMVVYILVGVSAVVTLLTGFTKSESSSQPMM